MILKLPLIHSRFQRCLFYASGLPFLLCGIVSAQAPPTRPTNPPRSLGDLVQPAAKPGEFPPPPRIDETKANAAGLRKLAGTHVTIYTDVPAAAEVEELPQVFDAAVPLWCSYFNVDPKLTARWQLVAYLAMDSTKLEKFRGAGLWPADLPPFLNGFQQGAEFWEYDQPSAYYRRHLMIHEGTHAFMSHFLGGNGPPWFNEGMAELLGTHLWQNGKLQLNVIPAHRDDAPYWGRVKILKDEFAAGRALMPIDVMRYPPGVFLNTDAYGWSWGLTYFFDHHPVTSAPFKKLKADVADRSIDFSRRFYEAHKADWPNLEEDWQIFVSEADYGYDVSRAAVVRRQVVSVPAGGTSVQVLADRGWNSSGLKLEANVAYQVRAIGRYQIAKTDQVWWCEPGGVTIRYHQGQPLGMLVAGISDLEERPAVTPLLNFTPIGLEGTIKFAKAGTLYLKVNEAAAGLSDNAGELRVSIQRAD